MTFINAYCTVHAGHEQTFLKCIYKVKKFGNNTVTQWTLFWLLHICEVVFQAINMPQNYVDYSEQNINKIQRNHCSPTFKWRGQSFLYHPLWQIHYAVNIFMYVYIHISNLVFRNTFFSEIHWVLKTIIISLWNYQVLYSF